MRFLSAALTVVAAVAAFANAPGASAHARYQDSTPARGEVLEASPPEVSITFTQELQRIAGTYSISVTNAAGVEFTAAPAVIASEDRRVMTAELQPGLPPGRYVVRFTNVSDADGDAWAGGFSFYVGVQPTEDDLSADEELLAQEEAEDLPATASPANGVASTPTVAAQPSVTPVDSVGNGSGDEDSDNNALLWVALAVSAGIAVGGVAFALVRRSRTL
jgi:methionine-rich copper-binding protein CopC